MNAFESIDALMRIGGWSEAQACCREGLLSRPTDAKLHAYEGICFFRMGRFGEAEPCFMRATALDPSFIDAGVKRSQCLEAMRRYDDAVHCAREWRAKRPSDPTLAALLHRHGNRPDPLRTEAWQRSVRPRRCVEYAKSA